MRTRRLLLFAAFGVLILGTTSAVQAGDCSVSNGVTLPQGVTYLKLGGNMASTFLDDAAKRWNDKCDSYYSMPKLTTASVSGPLVSVNFYNRARDDNRQGDGCEVTIVHRDSNLVMTGATISIYAQRRGGDACRASTEDLVVHGFGHALGLDDPRLQDGSIDPACDGTIMGRPIPGTPMEIQNDHCTEAEDRWKTEWEMDPCNDPSVPICECDPYETCSPILLDLGGDGFELTGPDDPVSFDINADGTPDRISWTAPSSLDGFLVWDRNANGEVDDGAELFGTATPLIDGSTASNGYIPLKELDLPALGGNENGWIDPDDSVFSSLRIWIDSNHNGQSESSELFTLGALQVTKISYDYMWSHKVDRWGNQFFFRSRAWLRFRPARELWIWTADVAFVDGN